jgi:hypothetical protein
MPLPRPKSLSLTRSTRPGAAARARRPPPLVASRFEFSLWALHIITHHPDSFDVSRRRRRLPRRHARRQLRPLRLAARVGGKHEEHCLRPSLGV